MGSEFLTQIIKGSETQAIMATLERAFRRNAMQSGTNHSYAQVIEASHTHARGIPAATRLETLMPGTGHLVHMPAHICLQTKQISKVAKSNADAAAMNEANCKRAGGKVFMPWRTMGTTGSVSLRRRCLPATLPKRFA